MNGAALALALLSAGFYAWASALQHRAARREEPQAAFNPRLLLRLLRRPVWLVGEATDISGTVLQAAALAVGPLALVQPVVASSLIFAIPLEASLDRRRPRRRDLSAVVLSAAALATFVVVAQPQAGLSAPSTPAWIVVIAGVGAIVAVCVAFAHRTSASRRATLLGIATGALLALVAALAKFCVSRFTTDPLGLLVDWQLYALAVVGIAGLLLSQNAFQAGPLAGPLTALTLANPVLSLLIAVTAFQETLASGGGQLAIELLAAAVMAYGIWLASTAQAAD